MREYVLEKHPDKLEILDTCLQLGDIQTEHYWCYLKDKVATDLYSEEPEQFVGVFTTKQMGYKLADETVPYPTDDELAEAVKELKVSGEDLKKTKWQLLAEAYINAQN